jgi:hypothetical protein
MMNDNDLIRSENDDESRYIGYAHPPKGFLPGVSGNPAGRPKKTEEEKQLAKKVMSGLQGLGDMTIESIEKILDPKNKCQAMARVKMIEIILAYLLGKPSAEVKLNISADEMAEDSEIRIAALIQAVRGGKDLSAGYEALTEPIEAEAQEEQEAEEAEGSKDVES